MSLRELLFGRPLRSEEEQVEQIGVFSGVPVLGLDALASASYGPEAALTILLPLGTLSVGYIGLILACVIAVLLAVFFSYRQTIPAYPQGGGSYTVAKENLGWFAGVLAASALSLDYILNVAVAISAGVGALISALPPLLPYTLWLCLGILIVLTVVNLRGIRSAGLVFMLPTYLFVLCLAITIVIGVIRTIIAHGHPIPMVAPPKIAATLHAASAWLLLRAFASGCTALTGVEAVSNAVPIFRQPTVVLAKRTLAIIVAILAFLLAGVAVLSRSYGITATEPGKPGYQSVLSQIVAAAMGRGAFYYISMAAILLVLALSANTSFADFPRVCRVLALDQFLPAGFAHRGSRLVYSAGILVLALLSGTLLVVFGGITDRLIPLFAIGAFSAFTMSQLGMVFHWKRSREPHARHSMIINALGFIATASTLLIIAASKFKEGAWITLLVVPPLVLLFTGIKRHHSRLDRETDKSGPLEVNALNAPVVVIPIKRLDRVARKGLRLGLMLSEDVRVVQILAEELKTEDLTHEWGRLVEEPVRRINRPPPKLIVLPSAYRDFFEPFLDYVRKLVTEFPGRRIAVVIPELVESRWYHFFLRHRATVLKGLLLVKGGPQIVVISEPWYLPETLSPK